MRAPPENENTGFFLDGVLRLAATWRDSERVAASVLFVRQSSSKNALREIHFPVALPRDVTASERASDPWIYSTRSSSPSARCAEIG